MSELYEKMMKQYPMLFCQRNKSMQETCMCWGIEAGDGWYKPLNELCSYLEILNNTYYPKYRIRIQADQVKEKYGELRFYYSVILDPNAFNKFFMNSFLYLYNFINNHVSFEKERVAIIPASHQDKKFEITKEIYEKHKDEKNFIEENGKYYQIINVFDPGKYEFVIKKHKLLYKINNFLFGIYLKIKCNVKYTNKKKEIGNMISDIADSLIKRCEDKCWNVCEWCGKDGGFNGENLITTSGWISRICKECHQKSLKEKQSSESNKISSFDDEYDYLNAYHYESFEYNKKTYHSIAEAFYYEKEKGKYKKIFESVFNYSKSEYLSKISMDIFKYLKIKINKNDNLLLKEIIKSKFSNEKYNKLFNNIKDYELHNYNNYDDNIFGECYCHKCNKLKNKGLYVNLLNQFKKDIKK